MVEVRACLYVSVIILCFHSVAGKPIFNFLCDFLCDDDDFTSTSSNSDYDWCDDGCSRPRRTTTRPNMGQQGPLNLMIPPSNGMNLSLSNNDGSWLVNLQPWLGAATSPGVPGALTSAPGAATPVAGATTAASGATTAAATTAATTAAAGK